jgi:lipid II:glycine glycyltransferase (peptidoglycan interpeptide bridge formation enzyme)
MPDSAQWDQFVAASPYGDVLQCREWGEVKKPDWQPVPVALQENGEVQATALVLRRALPRTGRSIFYVPRGPILDWSRPEVVRALIARQHRAVLIKIDPAIPVETPGVVDTLRGLGFVSSADADNSFGGTQPRFNMKLDISAPLDDVMGKFHSKWRYNIRLAERKGE